MTELGLQPPIGSGPRVYITLFGPELVAESLKLAHELRAAGVSVVTALQPDKLGKQFKEADQKGVPYALVLGPDELTRGEVVVKNLRSGEQQSVSRDNVAAFVPWVLALVQQ